MRNIRLYAMAAMLLFALSACDNGSSSKTGTISDAELTEREKAILEATANQSFVFDFNAGDEYKELAVWVEKYESGKLVGEVNHISMELKNKGTIIFATSNTAEESDQAIFTVSISSGGSTGSSWNAETIPNEHLGALWGSNHVGEISAGKKLVLASILYSDSEDGISTLSTGFNHDMESHMDELKNYDVVYLLRSEFK